jgi:hypothetical protein
MTAASRYDVLVQAILHALRDLEAQLLATVTSA